MNILEYKGYKARVEFDSEEKIFTGKVVNTLDTIVFQGTSVPELEQDFKDSIEDYISFCLERGEKPEKPCSGKFHLRLDPNLHRLIAVAAEARVTVVDSSS